jgi:hypothetical protein
MSSDGGTAKETSSSNSLRHKCNISIINMDNNNKTAKNTRRNYEAQVCTLSKMIVFLTADFFLNLTFLGIFLLFDPEKNVFKR